MNLYKRSYTIKSKNAVDYMAVVWDDITMICRHSINPEHICDSCVRIPIWNTVDNARGTGKELAERAFGSLKTLAAIGIVNNRRDHTDMIWSDGIIRRPNDECEPMPLRERLEVLCLHLRRLMNLGLACYDDPVEVYDFTRECMEV